MKKQIPHDSAHKHVSGEAVYVDDIPANNQLLTGKVVYSPHAHARIKSFDLKAARQLAGVHAVLCFEDIPGNNQLGAIVHDEPCLAEGAVNFIGQAVFLIAAENDALCRRAEKLIKIEYEPLGAILNIESAMTKNSLMGAERKIACGDVEQALKSSTHTIKGELFTGAQEHWYLETQAALCTPGEGKEMAVISSTQSPSETQAIIAGLLDIPRNEVVVEVRRMGGAFGGKETQGHHIAGWAALLAQAVKRPVKIRLFRDDDQIMTGKRHPFLIKYEAGFDKQGVISAVKVEQNSDGGAATDLSFAILERAMLHADNAYYIPNMSIKGRVWKTNLPSNTAFRGFGGPQGMAAMETIIDRIARFLHKDSAEIRYKNFYGINERNITPYGQTVENNHLFILYEQLMESSQYKKRRKEIDLFNSQNEFYKKGLAITPVKFGISFTTAFLNQAGALVNIYQDGTVLVNHGGTEMGQGLDTKIQQIAAAELGVSLDKIKLSPTNTSKVPNTSPTAASTGTDLNGMAVRNAMEKLKARISNVIADHFNKNNSDNLSRPENIVFKNDWIYDSQNPGRKISFVQAIPVCYVSQISLSATGYYRTPNIDFDRQKGKGKPFHYFAFGMAVTEVLLDTLTGFHEILRTDILHDVGDSINPGLDIGQIEGAYIQGVGWCTTEECKWDEKGRLLNHSPDTYKIPSVKDIPKDFRSKLIEGVPNPGTIRKSKAVGEPPFMLALSAWLAIKDAVSAVGNHQFEPEFSLPATNEVILLSIEKLKVKMRGN
jgi:xanthine dehydrogenase molybdopterin binding subunit